MKISNQFGLQAITISLTIVLFKNLQAVCDCLCSFVFVLFFLLLNPAQSTPVAQASQVQRGKFTSN